MWGKFFYNQKTNSILRKAFEIKASIAVHCAIILKFSLQVREKGKLEILRFEGAVTAQNGERQLYLTSDYMENN